MMSPVRDAEKHNIFMAKSKKNFCRYRKLATVHGSAGRDTRMVGHYFYNQIVSPVAMTASGAPYL